MPEQLQLKNVTFKPTTFRPNFTDGSNCGILAFFISSMHSLALRQKYFLQPAVTKPLD